MEPARFIKKERSIKMLMITSAGLKFNGERAEYNFGNDAIIYS